MPVSTLWSAKEIAYVAEDALLKALVVERSLLDAVLQAENLPAAGMLLIIVNDIPATNDELRSTRHHDFSKLVASGEEALRSCPLESQARQGKTDAVAKKECQRGMEHGGRSCGSR